MPKYINKKEFGARVDRVNRIMKIDLIKRFKEVGLDLTSEQWVVLSKTADHEVLTQTQIANASYKDAPTVSRIIDILCKKGYMARSDVNGDRRKFNISLTTLGKSIHEKALPKVLEARKEGWHGLSASDYDDFIRMMDVIMENYLTE